MIFGGFQGQDRRDRFGNPQTLVKLFDTGMSGLRGAVTIGGKRFKVFVTRAKTPKKPNHTHWLAVTLDSRFSGHGFSGGGRRDSF